jgi:hypothetical protein
MRKQFQNEYRRAQGFRPGPGHKGGHVIVGIGIAAIGALILLRLTGLLPVDFRFTWPVVLVVIGLVVGLKTGFRKNAWWILILIGGLHLIPRFEINGTPSTRLVWPAILVVGGLVLAFSPRRHHRRGRNDCGPETVVNDEHALDTDVTFGGRKEIVTSKEFKGGRVQVTFGGYELNLMQADNPAQPMVLDVKVSFAGMEIIVPSHWEIKNDISASLGSVVDHRTIRTSPMEEKRVLILQGSVSFGSVGIKSY